MLFRSHCGAVRTPCGSAETVEDGDGGAAETEVAYLLESVSHHVFLGWWEKVIAWGSTHH